ncbi:MAG: hypothetical protein ACXVJF_08770 [Acidimicrobiia bacterium]
MRRLLLAAVVAVTLLVVPTGASAADEQFTLTTTYVGLFPNADVSVPVTVHNPRDYVLAVHTAAVTVGDAGPGCDASNLVAESFRGDVLVAARRDATIPIHMHMPADAPDACQGATFPLTFTATGSPASGGPGRASGFAFTGSGFAFTGLGPEALALATIGAGAVALGIVLLTVRRRASAR